MFLTFTIHYAQTLNQKKVEAAIGDMYLELLYYITISNHSVTVNH